MTTTPEKDPGLAPGSFTVEDLMRLLLDRLVVEGKAELRRANGATGRIQASVEVHVVKGKPRWHSASLHFAEHQQYGKDSIVG